MLAVKLGSAGEGGAGVSEAEGGEYEGSVPAGGAAVVSTCMLAVEGGDRRSGGAIGAASAPSLPPSPSRPGARLRSRQGSRLKAIPIYPKMLLKNA
jgi:hypothetical protein